jgi:outer membrane protein
MVAMIAQWRKMNYIVKVSNQPISGTDPNSVMGAISSTVVYADPRNDITSDVVHNLNRFYHSAQSPTPKASTRTPGAAAAPADNGARTDGN